MATYEIQAVDIVCNLFTDAEVALRGDSVGTEFLSKVRIDAQDQRGVPIPVLLDQLDEAGVEFALLPAVKAGEWRCIDSWYVPYDRVAEVCSQYPDRFRGLAGIDPTLGMRGLRELESGVKSYGFVGAHLYPHWFGLPPDHALYYPIYAKCCELGIPIMMQVGHCLKYGRQRTFPSVGRPAALDIVACDFPELVLIGIHIGYPWTDEMISVSYKHENVYIGCDAYAPKYWPDSFKNYVASWGQEKVLFGTDFPVIGHVRSRREIEAMGLPESAKRKLLSTNARRLFQLPGAESGSVKAQ